VDFPHVRQVFCVQRDSTQLITDKQRSETVYGITSLSPQQAAPERLLELTRAHWTIENRLHYVRDVTFDEDRCRIRKGAGARVMASLRNLAISLLRMAGARYIAPALRACSRLGQNVLRLIGLPLQL
jgi:predicted transposase YbfD/YdcC